MAEEKSVFDLTEPLDVVAYEFLSAQSKTAKEAVARIAYRLTGRSGRPTRQEYDELFDVLYIRGSAIRDAQRDSIVASLGHTST